MACGGGRLSAFEQKKQQLINVNLWKSNFVSIWRKYGTFKDVGGVECFDYYRIDGDGEGQKRMSKHLKQPTLWDDVQDDDLEWVHLVFNFSKLVEVNRDNIDKYRDYLKDEIDNATFDHLYYKIEDAKVIEHYFSNEGEAVDDEFLNHLSLRIAERKVVDLKDAISSPNDYEYDEDVDADDIKDMVNWLTEYTQIGTGPYSFVLPVINHDLRRYLLESGTGTDILDELVVEGVLVGLGNVDTQTMEYALPVDVAKKMNGNSFVEMVQNALDFDYKVESHWYDFFVEFAGMILAVIAAYFGQVELAIGLMVSSVAQISGLKGLEIVATLVSIYTTGGLSSLADMGVSEAVNLLSNLYSLYVELKYSPDANGAKDEADSKASDSAALFYKAPYEAYNGVYCYKELISVGVGSSF